MAKFDNSGVLVDSKIIESGGEVIIDPTPNTTGRLSIYAKPGEAADVRLLSTAIFNPFTFGNTFPSDLGARLTFAGANEGGLTAQGFSDSNAPAFRFQGHIGSPAPTQFPIIFEGFKSNGLGDRAPLVAAEPVIGFYNVAFDAGGAVLLAITGNGNVGRGTTTPARKLHISDAMRLQPIASPPANPASGDLYFDTSEALCVYVNGAWAKLAGSGTCKLTRVTRRGGTSIL